MTVRSSKELRLDAINPSNPQDENLLTNAPLNVTQTVTIPVDGFDKMALQIIYTYDSATEIQVTPTVSLDGVNYSPYISTDIVLNGSTMEGTNYAYVDLFPVSADVVWTPTYPTNSFNYMKFEITSTAGTANDVVTVSAIMGVGPSI